MALSSIGWTDYTNNAWNGCTGVSPGCDNCYAEARDARFGKGTPPHFGKGKPRQRHKPATRNAPRKWNRETFYECTNCGWRGSVTQAHTIDEQPDIALCHECEENTLKTVRARVFAQSLSDTFDNEVPTEWRDELLALMEECTNLDWLVLTKRIGNVRKMVPARWLEPGGWPQHIRLGISVVNQKEANRDIPVLLALNCPNFVSMEPLLDRVDLTRIEIVLQVGGVAILNALTGDTLLPGEITPIRQRNRLHWIIVGGESGRGEVIRVFHLETAELIVTHCGMHAVPVFVKQLGARPVRFGGIRQIIKHKKGEDIDEFPASLKYRQFPDHFKEAA
jgi:protein gp37